MTRVQLIKPTSAKDPVVAEIFAWVTEMDFNFYLTRIFLGSAREGEACEIVGFL